MKSTNALAAALVALTGIAAPAHASEPIGFSDAVNIRELNMMLMATSLRCRTTVDDFRVEYENFNRNNLDLLNRAHDELRRNMHELYGEREGDRELDRLGTEMANQYGGGHPWLDCALLKEIVYELSFPLDHAQLADAAAWVLRPPQWSDRR